MIGSLFVLVGLLEFFKIVYDVSLDLPLDEGHVFVLKGRVVDDSNVVRATDRIIDV